MKNKPVLISIVLIIVLLVGFILYKRPINSESRASVTNPPAQLANSASSAPMSIAPADKIEVVHFHGIQQCTSCIAVGKFAKQTIDEKFPEEVKSGKIVFKEINAELPENQAIVSQYQARGSSLFVNAIRGKKDSIAEDTTVWRLVNSEPQYLAYFEGKLNSLLGK